MGKYFKKDWVIRKRRPEKTIDSIIREVSGKTSGRYGTIEPGDETRAPDYIQNWITAAMAFLFFLLHIK